MINDTIESHVYDVDAIATYYNLSKIEFTNKNVHPKEKYLEIIKNDIESFCKMNDLYFPFYFNQKIPLVIPSTTTNFELYVGQFLIAYDIPKIEAFLSYQKTIYKGKRDFIGLVEFLIYKIIVNNSPIDNTVRLEKIMQWVSKERSLKTQSEQSKKLSTAENEVENGKIKLEGFLTQDYALYHYYKQLANYSPPFEKTNDSTKRSKMKIEGLTYGVGGDAFANAHYRFQKKQNRICHTNIDRLIKVIHELSDFPNAQKKAEAELKEIPLK